MHTYLQRYVAIRSLFSQRYRQRVAPRPLVHPLSLYIYIYIEGDTHIYIDISLNCRDMLRMYIFIYVYMYNILTRSDILRLAASFRSDTVSASRRARSFALSRSLSLYV